MTEFPIERRELVRMTGAGMLATATLPEVSIGQTQIIRGVNNLNSSWTVEGFETGSLEDWEGVDTAKITSSKAYTGQKSLVITDQNDDGIGNFIHLSFAPSSPARIGAALMIDDGDWNSVQYRLKDQQGNKIHKFEISHRRENETKDIRYGGFDGVTLRSDISTYKWYYIELVDIQWKQNNIGEIRINGQVEATDIDFYNNSDTVSEVSLRIHDGGTGSKGYFDDVSINTPKNIQISPPVSIINEETRFEVLQSYGEASNFNWDFGDGETAAGEVVTHTYNETGNYQIELTIEQSDGTITKFETLTVATEDQKGDAGVTAVFDYTPNRVFPSEQVVFDASASSGNIGEYAWEFGDGTTETGPNLIQPTHMYDSPGEYDIELRVLDPSDTAVVDMQQATIRVEQGESTGFTISDASPTTLDAPVFDSGLNPDRVEQGDLDVQWNFGDGETATGATASHEYDSPGTYTVELTVDGTTTQQEVTVESAPLEVGDVNREIGGTLLPQLDIEEQVEATVVTNDNRDVDSVEFIFDGSESSDSSAPYDETLQIGDVQAPSVPLTVRAVATDGATHEAEQEIPIQRLPDWLTTLLDIAGDTLVVEVLEEDGEPKIRVAYDPLAALVDEIGLPIPDELLGGADAEVQDEDGGDGTYGLNVDFGGLYEPLDNELELKAAGGISGKVFGVGFEFSIELEGDINSQFELTDVQATLQGLIEVDIEPPKIPVPIAIPIPGTDTAVGVVPTIIFEGTGTFDFDGQLRFESATIGPGVGLNVTLGFTLDIPALPDGELIGEPSGGIEGAFDIGDELDPRASLLLGGRVALSPPLVPIEIGFENDSIIDVPLLGGGTNAGMMMAQVATVRKQSRRGQQPLPAVDSVDVIGSRADDIPPRERFRLSDRPYEDIEPAIASTDSRDLVVWARQDENKSVEAGHDLVGRWYDGTWSDPVQITDDQTGDSDPVAAVADSGEILVLWKTLDTDLTASDQEITTPEDYDQIRDESEIAYAIYDGSTWSTPTVLTDTGNVERRPTVAAEGNSWRLAWESLDRETGNPTVRVTTVATDGTTSSITDRANAANPDAGTRQDGQTDLAYLTFDNGSIAGVTHETLSGDTVASTQNYQAQNVIDVVTSNGRTVWVTNPGRQPTLTEATDESETTETLSLREDVIEARELALTTRDGQALLSYISTLGDRSNRDLVYRLDTGDGWIYDRAVADPEDEDLRLRYTDAEFTGPGSFLSAYAMRDPTSDSDSDTVSDVFVTEQTFAPAYAIDGDVDAGVAGEETTLTYHLENRGDTDGSESVTVTITSDGEQIDSVDHDPLASDELISRDRTVTIGDSGRFTVTVETTEQTLGTEPTSVELVAARPSLAIADVSASRTAETAATVAVTVENTGGAVAETVPVELADATGVVATKTANQVGVEGTAVVETTVDPTALDKSERHTVTLDPDDTLPEEAIATGFTRTYLVRPDLAVEDIQYRRDAGGPFVQVLVSNAGAGDGVGTLTIHDRADTLLASTDITLPPAETTGDADVPAYQLVELRVPELGEGDTVVAAIDPVVSNLRQESLTRVDQVEALLTGEFGKLPAIAGDRPPKDLDRDGLYENVRGDGEADIFDVQALFANLDNEALQNNAALFNFQGENPDEVTIFDVQTLFNDL